MDVDENRSSACLPPGYFESSAAEKSCKDVEMPVMEEDGHVRKDANAEWKGTPLDELQQMFGPWGPCPLPWIHPSSHHTVLYKLPVELNQFPRPYAASPTDKWDQDHVRMPNSSQSLYFVRETDDEPVLRLRWELVQEALLRSIVSSLQLESAILSYNSRFNEKWNFSALHTFFNQVFNEEETEHFFQNILPSMVHLALQLPEHVTAPIPLLKRHRNHSISISQIQVASLLANAFFCTFPRRYSSKRGSEYAAFPDINFHRLFQCGDDDHSVVMEKLKCIVSYFKRVCSSAPQGVLTFSRRSVQPRSLPDWGKSQCYLPKLYISSKGYIEDDGSGMLQVDFANEYVGGGVLGWGCVQEEIRFLICPELILSRLFTESLDSTEVLLIVGCERFSDYSGYGSSFKWVGEHHDLTPRDSAGRRHCSIVAMDALFFSNPSDQYSKPHLLREINKAYVGFYEPGGNTGRAPLPAVATGNWGCGAFRGDANLKALLQLMAAAQAGRPVAYFTFGDYNLRDRIFRMYRFLVENKINVGRLWTLLCQYSEHILSKSSRPDLYKYLYSAILDPVLPKEIPPPAPTSEISLQPIKGYVPKKPSKYKVESKQFTKPCGSTTGSIRDLNISEHGLSSVDLDSFIEEFDSDVEDQNKEECDEEMHKEIQEPMNRKEVHKMKENSQNNLIEREKHLSNNPSRSVSCLSLIEESLKTTSHEDIANRQKSQQRDGGLIIAPSAISSSSSRESKANLSSSLSSGASQEIQSICTTDRLEHEMDVTPSTSTLEADNQIVSSALKRVDLPIRGSGTKRKISDYFNPLGS